MDLETQIDELYQQSPAEFVRARNALAKTLAGAAAAQVRALAKPTVPAWAVNHLYWRDRRVFDRLVMEGARLRTAQVAALEGKRSDVRGATAAHRDALAAAVQRAIELARDAQVHVDADPIARTLEALSLAPGGVTPGRLTRPLQPAGFEALAGITPAHVPSGRSPSEAARAEPAAAPPAKKPATNATEERERLDAAAEREAKRRAAEARKLEKAHAARVRAADLEVERARQAEERARRALAEAQRRLAEAELKRRAL